MNLKTLLYCGTGLICISLAGMIYVHEYAVSGGLFLIGIVIAGFAYARLAPHGKPIQNINTVQINDNIQTFNGILWGKEQKKEEVPKESGAIRISGQTYEVDQILLKKREK